MDRDTRHHLHMSGGKEASGILIPVEGVGAVSDDHMRVILRRRLMCENPADATLTCQHLRAGQKAICGKEYKGDRGRHPLSCTIRGGKIAMHDKTRDEVANWLITHCNANTLTEQWVPKWSTDTDRAKLDISILDPTLGQIYVDITVIDSITGSEEKPMQGLEAAERKNTKNIEEGVFSSLQSMSAGNGEMKPTNLSNTCLETSVQRKDSKLTWTFGEGLQLLYNAGELTKS